jgi:single-strand DNA-binding protein
MSATNNVVLLGRLTRDAELKFTNTGFPIANLSLAVNRRVKKAEVWQEEASFFDAVLLGKRAESLAQYLKKGTQLVEQGELQQRRWEQEGQKRSKVEIVVNDVQFVGGGRGAAAAAGEAEPPTGEIPQPAPGGPGAATPASGGPTADDFNDDIPF